MMQIRIALLVCLALFAVSACSDDDPATTDPGTAPFSINGTLKFNKDISIPDDARLIVLWIVSAGNPDYAYVFGEGSISSADNSFQLSFDEAPPAIALNDGRLGVGMVFLTTDQGLHQDLLLEGDLLSDGFLGAISGKALIYVSGSPDSIEFREWAGDFESGFNLGKGVEQQSGFDTFAPDDDNNLELLIDDDASAFWFPNWT